jgi:hypothetical protein
MLSYGERYTPPDVEVGEDCETHACHLV